MRPSTSSPRSITWSRAGYPPPDGAGDGPRRQGPQRGPCGGVARASGECRRGRRRPHLDRGSKRGWPRSRSPVGTSVSMARRGRVCPSWIRTTGRLTEFYEAGLVLPEERWPDVEDALTAALAVDPGGTLVVLSGSLPPGAPPDAYRRLSVIAASRGARVAVDVAGPPLEAVLDTAPWLVKINASEAAGDAWCRRRWRRRRVSRCPRPPIAGCVGRHRHDGRRGRDPRHRRRRMARWAAAGVGSLQRRKRRRPARGRCHGMGLGSVARGCAAVWIASGAANALTPGQGDLDPADVAPSPARLPRDGPADRRGVIVRR